MKNSPEKLEKKHLFFLVLFYILKEFFNFFNLTISKNLPASFRLHPAKTKKVFLRDYIVEEFQKKLLRFNLFAAGGDSRPLTKPADYYIAFRIADAS